VRLYAGASSDYAAECSAVTVSRYPIRSKPTRIVSAWLANRVLVILNALPSRSFRATRINPAQPNTYADWRSLNRSIHCKVAASKVD
jgi:hypothetical protein